MDSLRQRQIDEVLQYDKVINSRVFGREVDQVAQFNDPKSRPNKDDITFQAEIEKRVEELMNTIQKMSNNISDVNVQEKPSEPSVGAVEGEETSILAPLTGPLLSQTDIKNLKSLSDTKSLKDRLNTSENLTADVLSRYNSLVDYILQYKKYTIYGNQSVQDAQFTADKVKSLLQPLKSLLIRIQSSDNDELLSKSYNVLNKIIEAIESAPPFIKIDNNELNKETAPNDVSKLEKYYSGVDKKIDLIDKKINKARSIIVYSERDKVGKDELLRQLESQKRELQLERAKGEEPEVKYAIQQYKEVEDESLTPEERKQLLERFNKHISALEKKESLSEEEVEELDAILGELVSNGTITDSQRDKLFERIVRASPTGLKQDGYKILSSAINEYQSSKSKELGSKQEEYSRVVDRINVQLKRAYEAIEKANNIDGEIQKLENDITQLQSTITPATKTRRRNQIQGIINTKRARITTLQSSADYKSPAQLRALKALITRYNTTLADEKKRILGNGKSGGRKFQGQYAPTVDDYDEDEYGDTNQNDNLEDIDEDYIVEEDDIQVGRGKKSKKVCMPKKTYMNEHHHLISLLDEASGKLGKEARKQKNEIEGSGMASDLEKFIKKKGGRARVNPGWTKESFEARQKQGFYKGMTWEQFQEQQRKFYEDSEKMKAKLAKQQQEYEEQIKRDPDSEIIWCKIDANGDRVKGALGDQATKRECKARHQKNYEKTDPIGAKFFSPLVKGLTKIGDLAADFGSAVGLPPIVSDIYKAVPPPDSKYYKGNGKKRGSGKYDADPLKKGNFTKQNEYASIISKQLYPKGRIGPSNENDDKAYNMAMAIDKASRKKVQLGKEEVKALKPVLPLGGIPEMSASGAGRVTKGEDFGALLAKLKDGKKSRELKKAKKTVKVKGGALSFNDDNNNMFD